MPDLAALDRDLVAGGDRSTEEGEGEVGEDRRRFLPMDREPVFEYVFERIAPPLRFRFRFCGWRVLGLVIYDADARRERRRPTPMLLFPSFSLFFSFLFCFLFIDILFSFHFFSFVSISINHSANCIYHTTTCMVVSPGKAPSHPISYAWVRIGCLAGMQGRHPSPKCVYESHLISYHN